MPAAQVPAPLRRSASFAPARRAKLVGRQIVERLAVDDEFRERLATQAKALVPRTVDVLEGDEDIPAADLAQVAALAYLVRGEGWQDVVESARDAERRQPSGADVQA